MEPRARASGEQFSTLLEFMERHGDITKPQPGPQGRLRADGLWQQLASTLNSIGGGVHKTPDRWKKVWADWKSKTKTKALKISRHASGTGGGPRCNLTLTTFEERLLGIMGVLAVEGQPEIEEQGFNRSSQSTNPAPILLSQTADEDGPPSPPTWVPSPDLPTPNTPPPSTRHEQVMPSTSGHRVMPSTRRELVMPSTSCEQLSSAGSTLPQPRVPPPPTTPTRPTSTRRLQPPATPSTHSSINSPRRRFYMRARRRRAQAPFDRATSEFVAVEHRRLQLEEKRERNDSRRIDAEVQRNTVMSRLADIAQTFVEHYLSRDNTERLNNSE